MVGSRSQMNLIKEEAGEGTQKNAIEATTELRLKTNPSLSSYKGASQALINSGHGMTTVKHLKR